jgi:hypothetical protein
MKNILFLAAVIVLLPFAAVGFAIGFTACGVRGGYRTAEEFARWLTT